MVTTFSFTCIEQKYKPQINFHHYQLCLSCSLASGATFWWYWPGWRHKCRRFRWMGSRPRGRGRSHRCWWRTGRRSASLRRCSDREMRLPVTIELILSMADTAENAQHPPTCIAHGQERSSDDNTLTHPKWLHPPCGCSALATIPDTITALYLQDFRVDCKGVFGP